jgi:hypothetical protein
MKTKTLLVTILCGLYSFTVCAQTSDAEAEALINLLGVQKKEAVAQLVNVSEKDSAAFRKIYDQYQKENKETAKARIKLYERTAAAYDKMSPVVADSLANRYFVNRMTQEKSLEEYYKKIKTATNAVTAFEFYQAEVYLLTMIRANIMRQIPTYGELQRAAKK